MKPILFSCGYRLALFLGAGVLAGCSVFSAKPERTRFYLLTAAPVVAPAATAATPAPGERPSVGICRIEIPEYLRSPAVVLRPGGTEWQAMPDTRWAEPLEQGIARVLRESLAASPQVGAVVVYPAPQAALPRYEVVVRVLACEGSSGPAGQGTHFVAAWQVRSTAAGLGSGPVAQGLFRAPSLAWPAGDAAALTAALGQAVAALGQELAAAVPP